MKKKEEKIPNPGSDEAIKLGCKCPVLDNNHGEGFPCGNSKASCFWINEGCPLHSVVFTPWWQLKKYGGWK